MYVDKESDLSFREKIIYHLSDALPEKDLMVDIFFVFLIDIRLEVPDKFAEHENDQSFMLHALPSLEPDTECLTIFLRCVGR